MSQNRFFQKFLALSIFWGAFCGFCQNFRIFGFEVILMMLSFRKSGSTTYLKAFVTTHMSGNNAKYEDSGDTDGGG